MAFEAPPVLVTLTSSTLLQQVPFVSGWVQLHAPDEACSTLVQRRLLHFLAARYLLSAELVHLLRCC